MASQNFLISAVVVRFKLFQSIVEITSGSDDNMENLKRDIQQNQELSKVFYFADKTTKLQKVIILSLPESFIVDHIITIIVNL